MNRDAGISTDHATDVHTDVHTPIASGLLTGLPPGLPHPGPGVAHAALHAWIDGGAGDGRAVRANEAAWADIALWPRSLRPLAGSHTRVALPGGPAPVPWLVAPMAYQRAAHPDGEAAMAVAAAAQGAGFVLSCQSSTPLQDVARLFLGDPGRGPLWFQLHPQPDPATDAALLARAEAAGVEAIVMTVDAPLQGPRDAERAAGWRVPPGVAAVNLPPAAAPGLDALLAASATTDTLRRWRGLTRLPLLVKGVLHPADAVAAVEAGADGLIVSNHGGRQLASAVPTARALPAVVAAVGGRVPVLVDGGLRRGEDVVKALALGARAVLLGRPLLRALALGGAPAVATQLRGWRDEFTAAQALCGARTPDELSALGLLQD